MRPPCRRRTSMYTRRFVLSVLPTLALAGCGLLGPDYLETREVTVGPTLARCQGVGLQSCMVVDGEFFYDGIEGFTYEPGYDYRLRVGKYDPWGGGEPPQDAGRYAYRLLEQLEKTPAPSTPATLSLGPTRVTCIRGDDFCLVLDGKLYDDMITSFEFEPGDHYVLDANRYRDGRYVLREVAARTRATGTEEEITVDRHRVECDDGHPGYCKVVNGAPYRGEIVGFQPRHEDNYRLRVERFAMFPEGVTGAPYIPVYGYRWLETLERTPGG
ncbi:MAG: DUF4377 domain-containing protein [Gemmatimonadetes bacterium]|nr:DUF4377 domain-containing protein [Gemmatimonadota bacterium]MYC91636.1 DUF4377 domain-containing protein [Gemmatimonadota bacterium]